ncbi:MAG: hypothetical protein JNL26_04535, partial [Gemmatimonadetes bacterium]|nr:hypothetical protein [Gemmatimonadota bacterium]
MLSSPLPYSHRVLQSLRWATVILIIAGMRLASQPSVQPGAASLLTPDTRLHAVNTR